MSISSELGINTLSDWVGTTLSGNPYFSAGAGLAGLGILAAITKRVFIVSNSLLRRKFVSTLELTNEDRAYQWVLDYINKHSTRGTNKLSVSTFLVESETGKTGANFSFLPSHGTHYFNYRRRLIAVERTREKQSIHRVPLQTVNLSTISTDLSFWKNFMEDVAADALSQLEKGVVVYIDSGPNWSPFGKPRIRRPLSSVILDEGIRNKLKNDVDEFIRSKKWWRCTYCLSTIISGV